MIPHILTLNAGSSSIKFGLYRLPDGAGNEPPTVARGLVDGIGAGPWIKVKNASGAVVAHHALPEEANHADGLETALGCLSLDSDAVIAVGHRIAHGAPAFPKPVVIDQRVFARLASGALRKIAPQVAKVPLGCALTPHEPIGWRRLLRCLHRPPGFQRFGLITGHRERIMCHQGRRNQRQAERSMKSLQDLERVRLHFLHGPSDILDHVDRLAPLFSAGHEIRQGLDYAIWLKFGDDGLLADKCAAPLRAMKRAHPSSALCSIFRGGLDGRSRAISQAE